MMVLYQSLIRNLFRSLYNLSVSVLLLSASAKARKCQQEGPMATLGIGIPGIPRDGNPHSPEFPARGEGKPNFSIAPQACDEGHKWGSLTPNSPSDWVLPCPGQGSETSPGALPAAPSTPRAAPRGFYPTEPPPPGDFTSSSSARPPQCSAKADPRLLPSPSPSPGAGRELGLL